MIVELKIDSTYNFIFWIPFVMSRFTLNCFFPNVNTISFIEQSLQSSSDNKSAAKLFGTLLYS